MGIVAFSWGGAGLPYTSLLELPTFHCMCRGTSRIYPVFIFNRDIDMIDVRQGNPDVWN